MSSPRSTTAPRGGDTDEYAVARGVIAAERKRAAAERNDNGPFKQARTLRFLSTDLKPINQAAYPKLIEMIEAGVSIFELDDGQGSLHTKCAAIGDACLLVGSYNMDPRSELYDTNNLIVLHDESGAAAAAFRERRIEGLRWTRLTVTAAGQLAAEGKHVSSARVMGNVL